MLGKHSTATLIIASLLWGTGLEGAPLGPMVDGGHLIRTRMVDSSKSCTTDTDCGDAKLTCDHEKKHCICKENYHVLSNSGDCLPAKQLGEACTVNEQCQLLEKHAVCTKSYCACDSGSYLPHDTNGTLCDPEKMAGGDKVLRGGGTTLDRNMIIVIAVLAIMFVGICVALHLFSKARFRNRRTIFNSPHPRLMHIKLGKRKKSSLRQQHLPVPGQPVPRHHSFSGHHSPFPVARIPKTRSHECLRSALNHPSPKFEPRCKTAPLAERESLPSTEDLERKTPDRLHNGPVSILSEEESHPQAPGSPTVIITDADGSHTVVTTPPAQQPSSPSAAVDV